MPTRSVIVFALIATCSIFALIVGLQHTPAALAAPHAQATATEVAPTPTPTEAPPNPGYAFPSPMVIPPYPGDLPTPTQTRTPTSTPTAVSPTAARPTVTPLTFIILTLTPTIPPNQTPITYVVEKGDSLSKIAQKVYGNGTKYPLIVQANNLGDTTLQVGMVLIIPPIPGMELLATPTVASTATPLPVAAMQTTPAPVVAAQVTPTSLAPKLGTPFATAIVLAAPTKEPTSMVAMVTHNAPPSSPTSDAETTQANLFLAINAISAILAGSSVISAILSIRAYMRARRLEEITTLSLRVRPPSLRWTPETKRDRRGTRRERKYIQ